MRKALGEIVGLLVEPGKEGADRLLVRIAHGTKMAREVPTSKRGRGPAACGGALEVELTAVCK